MIKAVIFDLWGTLAFNKNGFGSYIEKVDEIIGRENREVFRELREDWSVSRTSDEEFFIKLLSRLNKPLSMLDYILQVWNSQLDYVELYPDSRFVLELLKNKGYKVVLASNTFNIGSKAVRKLDLEKYFDIMFFSYNEGIKKPSPFVYKKILDRLNLKPEEVIVVGNTIEKDIVGAEAYGIKAVLIDRKNRFSYKNKIMDLEEIEFYLK